DDSQLGRPTEYHARAEPAHEVRQTRLGDDQTQDEGKRHTGTSTGMTSRSPRRTSGWTDTDGNANRSFPYPVRRTMIEPMRSSIALAAPFLLLVPVAFGVAFVAGGHDPIPTALGAGAAGWLLALVLRGPVGLIAMRSTEDQERAQTVVAASSGPLEELVRLGAVTVVGRDLGTAWWLGLGWAAIEVLYSIVNGFAMAALAERDDPEAERAKALMPPVAFSRTAPWWGIVERSWASALHIGFTLVVAAAPLAVVVTAPLHSGINLGFLQLLRSWSIGAVSAAGIVVASVVTTVGFLLH